jgi:hypothetical protein
MDVTQQNDVTELVYISTEIKIYFMKRIHTVILKTELCCLSPRANYTDRVAATPKPQHKTETRSFWKR